jgi:hypothetical protein
MATFMPIALRHFAVLANIQIIDNLDIEMPGHMDTLDKLSDIMITSWTKWIMAVR